MTTRGTTDEERIGELEGELAAAQRMIDVLVGRLGPARSQAAEAEPGDVVIQLGNALEERTRELEAVRAEARTLRADFERVVRQQTRALTESKAQLRRKDADLERQSKVKEEFISNASHELRTPLAGILGYLDLIAGGRFGVLPPLIDHPMSSVQRNAHRLKRLVEDMLDISRLEGRLTLRRGPVDLGQVMSDVVTELEPLALNRGQRVTTHIEPVEAIDADRDKLHQIAVNLVSNAIRYTPEQGEIVIDVDEAPSETYPGGWVRLRVRDSGVGIAKEDRKRIFDPFLRADSAKHHTSAAPEPAGLGLHIARGLIELHGGLITVDSQPGAFTEFTLLLPFKHDPGPDADPPARE
jgi:signal transduction histidine kinase